MTRNGKDRLAAALGESYPRVWRGLGLEAKIARNLPDIQDKKRPREMTGPVIPSWRARRARPTRDKIQPPGAATRHMRMVKQQLCRDAVPTLPKTGATRAARGAAPTSMQRMRCHRIPTLFDKRARSGNPRPDAASDLEFPD